jgi:hypothetical protein
MKDLTISANRIGSLIKKLVSTNSLNRLTSVDGGTIFNEPLIGVADGKDTLFEDYKRIIGNYYLAPAETILKMAPIEQKEDRVENISVICWTLPFAERIKSSNALNRKLPASLLWSQGQEQGEKFNDFLREQVVKYFRDRGYLAVAPIRSSLYMRFGRYQTNWSERHCIICRGDGHFRSKRVADY